MSKQDELSRQVGEHAARAHDALTDVAKELRKEHPDVYRSVESARIEARKQYPQLASIEKLANPDAAARAAQVAKAQGGEPLHERAARAIDTAAKTLHRTDPSTWNVPLHKLRIRLRADHPDVAALERDKSSRIAKAALSSSALAFLNEHAPE